MKEAIIVRVFDKKFRKVKRFTKLYKIFLSTYNIVVIKERRVHSSFILFSDK